MDYELDPKKYAMPYKKPKRKFSIKEYLKFKESIKSHFADQKGAENQKPGSKKVGKSKVPKPCRTTRELWGKYINPKNQK